MQLRTVRGYRDLHCVKCGDHSRCPWHVCQCWAPWTRCPVQRVDPNVHRAEKVPVKQSETQYEQKTRLKLDAKRPAPDSRRQRHASKRKRVDDCGKDGRGQRLLHRYAQRQTEGELTTRQQLQQGGVREVHNGIRLDWRKQPMLHARFGAHVMWQRQQREQARGDSISATVKAPIAAVTAATATAATADAYNIASSLPPRIVVQCVSFPTPRVGTIIGHPPICRLGSPSAPCNLGSAEVGRGWSESETMRGVQRQGLRM